MAAEELPLILNPTAGGARRGAADEILRLLAAHGASPRLHLTRGPHDAQFLAERLVAEGATRLAVAGGDGSVGEVTAALVGTGVAMGLIPLGTGNALGRELGLPLHDLPAACRIVAQGATRDVDVGICNDTHFAVMCGVGFDAEVAHSSHQGRWKRRLGKWGFVANFLLRLAAERPRLFRVTVDGEVLEERLWAVVACNTSQYSWRLRFAPSGCLDDGGMHVVLFGQRSRRQLLSELAAHWHSRGVCDLPGARCLYGSEIRIEADPPTRWQADGDVRGMSPVEIGVRPGGLRLIVPPKESAAGTVRNG